MMADPYQLDPAKIRSGFERAADSYDTYAFLQREVGRRLLERLELIRLQPDRVVDLGCSTGKTTEALLHKYPKAHVTGLDLALSMVHKTRRTGRWWRRPSGICADAGRLPFKADSIDMAVSNLMLQWCSDLPVVFAQLAQTLRPEGLLLFSTLGPDTLQELRFAWGQVDSYSHTSRFIDMHDVGDALLQAGFRDPVVDMELITLTYDDVKGLLLDLKGLGATNATAGRNRGLTGKQRLQDFYRAYEAFRQDDDKYPATYEVIYGHAWAPEIAPTVNPERYIPIRSV